jgi:cytidyltransferase-like protein
MAKRILTLVVCDILHDGHLNLFYEASKLGDLYVGIASNWQHEITKNKPVIMNLESRLRILSACKYVHLAYAYATDDDNRKMIEAIKPDLYVRGDDWKDFPMKDKIDEMKIPIKYLKYTQGISSTQIKEAICTKQ